jgi:hypothetical protein
VTPKATTVTVAVTAHPPGAASDLAEPVPGTGSERMDNVIDND